MLGQVAKKVNEDISSQLAKLNADLGTTNERLARAESSAALAAGFGKRLDKVKETLVPTQAPRLNTRHGWPSLKETWKKMLLPPMSTGLCSKKLPRRTAKAADSGELRETDKGKPGIQGAVWQSGPRSDSVTDFTLGHAADLQSNADLAIPQRQWHRPLGWAAELSRCHRACGLDDYPARRVRTGQELVVGGAQLFPAGDHRSTAALKPRRSG